MSKYPKHTPARIFLVMGDEDVTKEDAQEAGFLVLGGKCYCPNCYQYDDDDNIVTKDGKKFNCDTREEIKEGSK